MKRKRFSVEADRRGLKQAEVGVPVAELIRKVGISAPLFGRDRIHDCLFGSGCPIPFCSDA